MVRRFVLCVAVLALVPLAAVTPDAAAQAPTVVISELHYHPQADERPYPDYDDREGTEFIELTNVTNAAIAVGGWCLDAGIEYCFGAGASLAPGNPFVLARDPVQFEQVHGFEPDAQYDGRLSNSGELIRLTNAADQMVAAVAYGTSDPWPVRPDGNGASLELVSVAGNPSAPSNWAASNAADGTPGTTPNLSGAAPPLVVSHTAPTPAVAGQPVTITASAVNVSTVSITYDIDFGADVTVAMTPQGGAWQATLPALGVGDVMRFRFEASGAGGTQSSPRPDDAITWWATAVPTVAVSAVPTLDIHIADADWANVENRSCGCLATIVHEGRVWTGVEIRRAGLTSIGLPKGSYRLDFPDGHPFVASWLDEDSDELTLDQGYPNYDQIREQLSWKMMDAVGFPPIVTQHTRVSRNGVFRGLYLAREEQDGDWRSRHGFDRGAFYKFDQFGGRDGWGGGFTKKEALDESDADLAALLTCTQQSGAALRACLLDTVDVAQVVHELASIWMIRQGDQREFNWFLWRDDTEGGLWRLLPEDLDRVMTGDSRAPYVRCLGLDNTPGNEICRAIMAVPEFEAMFNRRLRTLVDEVLTDPRWIDEIRQAEQLIAADWQDDEDVWSRTGLTLAQYADTLENWFGTYAAHLRAGGHDGKVPAAQSANPAVEVVEVRADAGDGISWVLLRNPSAIESVDVSGWQFDGLATIADGAVILPGATIAITNDDAALRAAKPAFDDVRAHLEGTIAGQTDLLRRNGSIAAPVGDAPPNTLVLNEWNAVGAADVLPGGDPVFGMVDGNGGDWFELVVIDDNLDIRGWRLVLSDADGGPHGIRDEFVFSADPFLADLERGLIITISEDRRDDLFYSPIDEDWHVNFQANTADDGALFTAASQSNFDTNHHDWQLAIYDDAGGLVFGPAGEGIGGLSGVTSEEVGELEVDPSAGLERLTDYGDGNASTYGRPNVTAFVPQDLTALQFGYVRGDVNCDATDDIIDALFIAQQTVGIRADETRCPLGDAPGALNVRVGDMNRDGRVDIVDALVIAQCTVGIDHNGRCTP